MEIVLSIIALVIFVSGIFLGKDKIVDTHSEVLSEAETSEPVLQKVVIPSPSPKSQILTFIYPSSKVVLSSDNQLTLQSSDNPDKITDWYKEKIQSLGVNVKSFVTTKANNDVLNKLLGSSSNINISVEIKKEKESDVLITVILN